MTVLEALHFGRQTLQAADVPDYEYDANALLQYASGRGLAFLLGNPGEVLPKEAETAYLEMLEKRRQRIPLQQIVGETCFYGYMFRTRKGTLIPRSDTECLVEQALKNAPRRNLRFLDLCSGSGCIGISFYLERKNAGFRDTGILSDISEEALRLSGENAELLGAEVEVLYSDLFAGLGDRKFDLILSNPPYIPKAAMESLMPEVRLHEPEIALTDDGDGLSFYRRIAAEAKDHLLPGGQLFLEIGFDQGEAVTGLLKSCGYLDVLCIKDYAGLDRVVCARTRTMNESV